MTSIVESIGEENGEELFNIVEIEGEEPLAAPSLPIESDKPAPQEVPIEAAKGEGSEGHIKSVSASASDHSSEDELEEERRGDIIMNLRA